LTDGCSNKNYNVHQKERQLAAMESSAGFLWQGIRKPRRLKKHNSKYFFSNFVFLQPLMLHFSIFQHTLKDLLKQAVLNFHSNHSFCESLIFSYQLLAVSFIQFWYELVNLLERMGYI
jgi:hypothetical protein